MMQLTARFYRAKLFSFSLKENEYIGRLQFLGFNLVGILLLMVVFGTISASLLKYNAQALDDPLKTYLILGTVSLPYQLYFLRLMVLRLRDIFPRAKHSKMIVFSLIWLILLQGSGIASEAVNGFQYTDDLNIYDLFYTLFTLPMVIVFLFIGGREKPQPEQVHRFN